MSIYAGRLGFSISITSSKVLTLKVIDQKTWAVNSVTYSVLGVAFVMCQG